MQFSPGRSFLEALKSASHRGAGVREPFGAVQRAIVSSMVCEIAEGDIPQSTGMDRPKEKAQ